jgi:RNA polymerase sigma factor (sigma-70 family)
MSTIEFNDALINMESYLRSFAMTYTRNKEDANDLTQETMLKAIHYRTYYTPQTNFKAWLFTIMRNIFINQYRRKVKSGTIFDNSQELYLIGNASDVNGSISSQINTKEIWNEVENLENEYKVPFKMHFEGYKYQDISDELRIPIGTVKSRIFIARKKLMQQLPEFSYFVN